MKTTVSLFAIFCALAAAGAAKADPPTVVGRLSLIEGAAQIRHSYDQQWVAGDVNFPIVAGDGVWSDQNSRTEVEIGGSEARLDETSEIDIDRLDEGTAAFRVAQGVLNLTVRYVPPGGMQIMTTVGQLTIQRPGEYHIDAGRPNGPPTQLLLGVVSGEAMFSGLRGAMELRSGQGAMVPPDQSVVQVVAIYPTPFDQWAENRAGMLAASQTLAYVSPDMTGYQDLDTYGQWQPMPDYGPVWFPTQVGIGWAPYRNGHWDYVQPWGWTWIDEAPWGFAPFHYGRWAQFDGRWGWVPGERHERAIYAPALVAFVGGEPGGAHVGWVPLGPREVFHPYYVHSDTYVININRAHFHDEHEIQRFDHAPPPPSDHFANRQAVTQVNSGAFSGGQPVHEHMTPGGPGPGFVNHPGPVIGDSNHLPPPPAQHGQPGPAAAGPAPQQPNRPQQPAAAAPQPQQAPQPHPAPQGPPPPAVHPQQPVQPQAQSQPQIQQPRPQPQPQQQPQQRPQAQPQQQQQPKREPQDKDHQNQH